MDLPDSGIEPGSPAFFTNWAIREAVWHREGDPVCYLPCLSCTKSDSILVSPGMHSSSSYKSFGLNERLPFLENTQTSWPRWRPTWSVIHDHLTTHYLTSEGAERALSWLGVWIRKAEPGSIFFTQPFWDFQRVWNAINTNVEFAVVHYEAVQCDCYLTYKQLLPTNVNCHWDLKLLYTSEINLVLRLAQNPPLSCSQSSPWSGHV